MPEKKMRIIFKRIIWKNFAIEIIDHYINLFKTRILEERPKLGQGNFPSNQKKQFREALKIALKLKS
jgi:hypothetical protein